MSFPAMDLGWKWIHLLVVILIFLKHAVGHESWRSPNVQPQQNWPLRRVRSSMLEAPVSGSPNPSRTRFSLSSQSVKGGYSSSYEPVSPTQSAPSVSDSASLLRLQGSSSPNAQNVVSQSASRLGSYSWSALSSRDTSGLQGVSAQLASKPAQGGSSSGLPILSQSSPSLSTSGSLSKLSVSPLAISGLPTSDQSSSNMFTASSQSNSGLQLGGTSSQLSTQSSSSTGSSESSRRLFSSQGSSGPQLAGGSSQLTSTSGLLALSPSTESQRTSGSSYAKLAASPLGFSQSSSGQSSYSQYTSSSQSRVGTRVAASPQYQPGQGSGYGSSVQPQGTASQYAPSRFSSLSSAGSSFSSSVQSQGTSNQNAPSPFGPKVPVYSQAAPSGPSLSLSQPSQWQSSVSSSQSFQTSGAVASQSSAPSQGIKAPSRFSTSLGSPSQFASTQEGSGRYSGLSVQSQSTSSQYSPGPSAYAKLAASPQGVGQLTSGQGSYSQYTSSSQSRAGTQLSGISRFAPMRTGSTFTDGSSLQLQGTSSRYALASLDAKVPVYSQAASTGSSALSQTSTSRWSQGTGTSGTVASQSSSPSQGSKAPSRFSALAPVASPSQFASTQEGSARYSGLSIQSTSSQYSPGSSGYAKPAASPLGVSQSTSEPSSYSQYASRSQSRADAQLAGFSPYAPMQMGGTSTDGSSLQTQGTSSQYAPSLSSAKVYSPAVPSGPSSQWQTSSRWSQGFQASDTVASQSGPLSQASKTPSRFPTLSSAPSPGQFASTQEGSGRYGGLSSLSQGTSSQYGSGSLAYAKRGSSLAVSSQSTSDQSSSGLYASGAPLTGSSRYVPLQTGSTLTGGSSFQFQGTSNQYAPSVSSQYTQASPSGSSLTGSSGKWQTSASTWSQGFQASGAAVPPQSAQTSSGSSFLPALSPSLDSLAQSSSSSSRKTTSFFGVGLRPSKLPAQATSGSTIRSQLSPALSADSMTLSLGSSFQGASQGTLSGQPSDSTSVISSSYGSNYGQSASGFSRSSQSSSATGRYSSVKG